MQENLRGLRGAWAFQKACGKILIKGNPAYYAWVGLLLVLCLGGTIAYAMQLYHGLVVTSMRDPSSWGLYIGNFTFLVGIAAAAVTLVIPAYFYGMQEVKEIAIFGEILAISALLMCMAFVTVDLGRPDRAWHLMPFVGKLNFPGSPLAWDVLVLNGYLILNMAIVGHMLYRSFTRRPYSKKLVYALAIISVPVAISIHTVTAFIFSGLATRSLWSSAILAPRFIASAFCSGPAVMIILFQILRHTGGLKIRDRALWRLAEMMTYALAVSLFFLVSEIYTVFYPHTHHTEALTYLFTAGDQHPMAPYMWGGVGACTLAFFILVSPLVRKRNSLVFLNASCLLIFGGMYVEKAMGHVLGGFTPSPLGEVYEYSPTLIELAVGTGVLAVGLLVLTGLCKITLSLNARNHPTPNTPASQPQETQNA